MGDKQKRIAAASKALQEIVTLRDEPSSEDTDPDKVLAAAYGNVDEVVIAGTDKEGNFWFSSSVADGGTVLWLIEHLKMQLMGIETSRDNTVD